MHDPVNSFRRMLVGLVLAAWTAASVNAQNPNQVWFTSYNGQPTPSSDVSVESFVTGGGLTAGSVSAFVSQTNFSSFNSPFGVVVDPAMGKAYVLDNNVLGTTPEYIYSFNLTGTPAQIAASAQIIYTMPVPTADVTNNLYPLISGLTLDPATHYLYFNQIDVTTSTNSFIGRLDLTTSSASNVHTNSAGNPVLRALYTGQVPGQGSLALDQTNLYLGCISRTGNSGIFAALRDGSSGAFSEWVTISTNDMTFTNGFVAGVATDPADHAIYYLTFNAGYVNGIYNTNQNALWVYDMFARTKTQISSGYFGYPDDIAMDPVNRRYYFTVGRSGGSSVNAQGIYTGTLGSFAAPTLLYTPSLSGSDVTGKLNSGQVVLQGLYVEDPPTIGSLSSAVYPAGGAALVLEPGLVLTDLSSTLMAGATVAITSGTFTNDGDMLVAVTNGTQITATYNATNEILTLAGSDTVTNYQKVLQTVAFSSTRQDPSRGGANPQRSVAWTATDGVLSSATNTSTITTLAITAPVTNRVAAVASSGKWLVIFSGTAGKNYTIQYAASPAGPWSDLSPILTANSLGLVAYTDPTSPLPSARYYRVKAD